VHEAQRKRNPNRKFENWHKRVELIPDLVVEDGDEHAVCRKLERLRITADKPGQGRRDLLVFGVAALAIFVPPYGLPLIFRVGLFLAIVQIYSAIWLYFSINRNVHDYNLVRPLMRLMVDIESNVDKWDVFHFRVSVVRKLEEVARRLERIPTSSGASDPYVLSQLTDRAAECAASMRQLQVQVAMSTTDTWDNLSKDLSDRLLLLADGRWHELPRADLSAAQKLNEEHRRQKRGRTRIALSLIAALLAFGAAAGVVTQLNESIAALLTPFLISTSVTFLGAAGIELKALTDATNIAKEAVKGTSESSMPAENQPPKPNGP
jgi:hypothetical protein